MTILLSALFEFRQDIEYVDASLWKSLQRNLHKVPTTALRPAALLKRKEKIFLIN